MRLFTVSLLVLAGLTPLGLYYMKNEVRQMENEIASLNQTLTSDQEEIRVLQAEWSYLNQPARLDELSDRYLGLKPVMANQIMRVDDLPYRKLELVKFPGQASPSAVGIMAISARAR